MGRVGAAHGTATLCRTPRVYAAWDGGTAKKPPRRRAEPFLPPCLASSRYFPLFPVVLDMEPGAAFWFPGTRGTPDEQLVFLSKSAGADPAGPSPGNPKSPLASVSNH